MTEQELLDYTQLQKVHWRNVRAILRAADAIFALLEDDSDPPRQEVLRIAQDLVRDAKIKWQDDDGPN